MELSCTLTVNAAFERLFGLSQYELRKLVMLKSYVGLSSLLRLDSYEKMAELESNICLGDLDEFLSRGITPATYNPCSDYVVIQGKHGNQIPCILQRRLVNTDDGFTALVDIMSPLPTKKEV